jgi:hypothetical protein
MTMMTDAQLVKVFSLNFSCEVIASLHRDVRRKIVSPADLAGDLGKLRAFVDHVAVAFGTLTAGEQYSCELATRRVVDILRYAGHVEEAARIENALTRLVPFAA